MVSNIDLISNPSIVQRKFKKYRAGDRVFLELSERPDKKYKVILENGKAVHFGSTMEDYTKHKNEMRRQNYLARANGIHGNWKDNKYSPNNLSIHLLW
jgi:hypothetical protein